ncbi:MAG: ATP-binding protein [Polyangiales bacterium]
MSSEDVAPAATGDAEQWTTRDDMFRLLVASVKDYAIFMLDPAGHVRTWNRGAERLKQYSEREIVGKHFSVFYPPEDLAWDKPAYELKMTLRDGRFEDEGWRLRRDGSQFWANVILTALYDEQGELRGFAKVTRDLTDRKRVEEERSARLAAEHANKAKDELMAMLGHELRNPLAPIVTALQLMKLRGGSLSREQAIIERQVQHMVRLVDDLLDTSRLIRGKLELRKQPHTLRGILTKALEIASPRLEERAQQIRVELPDRVISLDADEARLVQVFTNLLTNASKFTPRGGHVVLDVAIDAQDVVVQVRDDGNGITPELLPRIFDLFVQGPDSHERASGGLGIGLALVKTFVTLHGGSVRAQSAGAGQGSTFTVRLPIIAAREPAPEPPDALHAALASSDNARRILIVDDHQDALDLMADALRRLGHQVRVAQDGFEALQELKAFRPEIAILDIGLPVLDGYELAGRIRAALGAAAPRLVALSGYGLQSDRERSHAAGFDRHLVKPVDIGTLIDCVNRPNGVGEV